MFSNSARVLQTQIRHICTASRPGKLSGKQANQLNHRSAFKIQPYSQSSKIMAQDVISKGSTLPSLTQQLQNTLTKRASKSKLRTLKKSAPNAIDFSSNDFLSLSTNKDFRRDYLTKLTQTLDYTCQDTRDGSLGNDHLFQHGVPNDTRLGSTGSRLLDGNSSLAEQLEQDIASFHVAESALLVNSGFDANVSIFSCIPQPGDVVIYDELIHASVHDGMKASRLPKANCISFEHNNVQSLRQRLSQHTSTSANVFVAVESVYSMDGDLAPLKEIVDLLHNLFPSGNAHLIVDEAHSTGVYGPQGRGRVAELGLENDPVLFVRLHTFGKALAANGAVILCPDVVRTYLINYARPVIYSTFMSAPMLVGIQAAYSWLQAGKTEQLAFHLRTLQQALCVGLERVLEDAKALDARSGTFQLDLKLLHETPVSPIIALLTRKPRELAVWCQERGLVARAVMSPTVPLGTERVRICLHAGNTVEEIQYLLRCIEEWVHQEHKDTGAQKVAFTHGIQAQRFQKIEPIQAKL